MNEHRLSAIRGEASPPWPWSEYPALNRAWMRTRQWHDRATSVLDPTSLQRVGVWAILASGSWGRFEVVPHSDADLLVVVRPDRTSSEPENMAAWGTVWEPLQRAGLKQPSRTGIYATCVEPQVICIPGEQGILSPSPAVYGQRIQLLLDSHPLGAHAPGSHPTGPHPFGDLVRTQELWGQVFDWFCAGALPHEPWWAYLVDELQRYFRGIRLLCRRKPVVELPQRWEKLQHSRFLAWAAIIAHIGQCSVDPHPSSAFLAGLSSPPLLRLATLFRDHGIDPHPWLVAYDAHLDRAERGDWVGLVESNTDAWQSIIYQFLLGPRNWDPQLQHRLLF